MPQDKFEAFLCTGFRDYNWISQKLELNIFLSLDFRNFIDLGNYLAVQ